MLSPTWLIKRELYSSKSYVKFVKFERWERRVNEKDDYQNDYNGKYYQSCFFGDADTVFGNLSFVRNFNAIYRPFHSLNVQLIFFFRYFVVGYKRCDLFVAENG